MAEDNNPLLSLLRQLKVRHTAKFAKSITEGYPVSNTLLGLKNILKNQYNIDSVGLKINKSDILKLDPPFIAQLNIANSPLVTVSKLGPDKITFIYKGLSMAESYSSFEQKWQGIVLVASPRKESEESNYSINRRWALLETIKIPFLLVSLAALCFKYSQITYFKQNEWLPALLLIFTYSIGLIISSLLLMISVNNKNLFIEKVCKLANKDGCNDILESNASRILGIISWSEIGFCYFAGSVFTILFVPQGMSILFWLSICSLPYSVWSVYYQYRVARRWCMLCLGIQFVFWLLCSLFIAGPFSLEFVSGSHIILNVMSCFLLPALAWWFVKPFILSHIELASVGKNYKRLLHSGDIVKMAFESITALDTHQASDIVLGNEKSGFTLTVVTDPFCKHCAEAHPFIDEVIKQYGERIRVQFVFLLPNPAADLDADYNAMVIHKRAAVHFLIALYLEYGPEVLQKVLIEWYASRDKKIEKLQALYPVNTDIQLIENQILKQKNWFKTISISGPPKVFINGRILPNLYDIRDIVQIVAVMGG